MNRLKRKIAAYVFAIFVVLCLSYLGWRSMQSVDNMDSVSRAIAGGEVGGPGKNLASPPPGVKKGGPLPNIKVTGSPRFE